MRCKPVLLPFLFFLSFPEPVFYCTDPSAVHVRTCCGDRPLLCAPVVSCSQVTRASPSFWGGWGWTATQRGWWSVREWNSTTFARSGDFLALFPSVGDFLSTCCFNIWRFSCAAPLLCPPPLNVLHFSPLFTPRKKLTRRRGGKWEKSGEKKDSPQKNGLKNFFSLSDLIKGWMDSQFCVGRCLWGSRRRSPPSLLFWK